MYSNFYQNLFKTVKNYRIQNTYYSNSINYVLKNNKIGDTIRIKGWIKSLRKQKENVFIDISDGSTPQKFQIIIAQDISPKNITTGAAISTTGVIKTAPNGQMELNAKELTLYGDCIVSEGYPFSPRKQYSQEYIRQHLNFRTRTNKFSALLRSRSAAYLSFNNYLTAQGYINVHSPILTSNDCEGAGEVFKVVPESDDLIKSMIKEGQSRDEAFFNSKTYLTVSGQMHLEAAVHGLSKVYTFGPTFRAENSKSRLHLAEFYMLEAEIAFLDKIENLMDEIENLLKNVTKSVLDSSESDIEMCRGDNTTNFNWLDVKFNILTYEEAINILSNNQKAFENNFLPESGISKEHELFLAKHCGNIPTFIINWPKDMKPFYMRECQEDKSKVLALDLIVPEVGEIIGGSLRENSPEKLKKKIPKNTNQLEWYVNLRRFGGVPTGGYGLGFERYLLFLTGISNIKDVIPFPRWPHNCKM